MAARVLQGRFAQDTAAAEIEAEIELLESVAVCVALSLLETVLEGKPARPNHPVHHFLGDLLRATRWELENALVRKIERDPMTDRAMPVLLPFACLWVQPANLPERQLGDPANQLHLGGALQALGDEFQAITGSLEGRGQVYSRLLVEVRQLFADSGALVGLPAQDLERLG